ncbi:MAG: hypothetical protein R2731_00935 [Nocardioides sp.]
MLALTLAPLATPLAPFAVADEGRVLVSTDPANYTPNVDDGEVLAIAQVGDTMVLGGTFTSVSQRGASFQRTGLVAFDESTGRVRVTFAPELDGEVTALAPASDSRVYVAGGFTTVNGERHRKLVQLDVSTGQVIEQFDAPPINGQVKDLKVAGGQVLIAGAFTVVDGEPRGGVASLAAGTGALTSRLVSTFSGVNNGGRPNVVKIDLTEDGSRLVAVGNFTEVDGQPRGQVAQLALVNDQYAVTAWATHRFPDVCSKKFNTYLRDVAFSPDGSYFVVVTTGGYHGGDTLCDSASRWETDRSGERQQPTWIDHTGGDTLDSVAVTEAAVYVGGHMRWLNNPFGRAVPGEGAVPHEGIAALDPISGLPYTWAASKQRGIGVFDLLATEDGLWVGSDTEWIQGERRARIAFLPLEGGEVLPTLTAPALPGQVGQLGRHGSTRAADEVRFTQLDANGEVGQTTTLTTKVKFRRARGAFVVGGPCTRPGSTAGSWRARSPPEASGPAARWTSSVGGSGTTPPRSRASWSTSPPGGSTTPSRAGTGSTGGGSTPRASWWGQSASRCRRGGCRPSTSRACSPPTAGCTSHEPTTEASTASASTPAAQAAPAPE